MLGRFQVTRADLEEPEPDKMLQQMTKKRKPINIYCL